MVGTTIKSTVTGSSLTSVGTLSKLEVMTSNGSALKLYNNSTTTNKDVNLLSAQGNISLSSANGKTVITSPTVGINSTSVGIGTTNPNSNSILELNSTSKGFLPPRMSASQRDLIDVSSESNVIGLMIYCTNCGDSGGEPQYFNGNAWVNMAGATPAAPPAGGLAVGDTYQGGKIFYILQSWDAGYDTSTTHGFIAGTKITPTTTSNIPWGLSGTDVVTYTDLGKGAVNTTTIISTVGINNNDAAKRARASSDGGHNDWFLPSKDEMIKLFQSGINIDSGKSYWTSSQSSATHAWSQQSGGNLSSIVKTLNSYYIIPIRSF